MTTYALVIDGAIQAVRNPRRTGEHKLSDGFLLTPPEGGWTDDLAALCGFVPVVDTPRPADTATTTHDRSVELVNGTPTVVWTERAKTTEEQTAATRQANDATIRSQVEAHMSDLAAITGSTGTLTGAQLSNAVRVLARGQRRLIRLAVGLLDGTD